MSARRSPAQRAARLLRWYPSAWRDRYGEEFTELLISDIEERPSAPGRWIDVAHAGLMARLGDAGLAGCPLAVSGAVTERSRYRQAGASLGSLACVLTVFVTVSAAPWSELVIDRQAMSPLGPPDPGALAVTGVLSVAMLTLLALAVLAALPVIATLAVRFATAGRAARAELGVPAAVLLASAAFLVVGGRHFGNGWPGTGGHGSFVPAGLAAFEWATSLSVSAYWAHPASFEHFPAPEVCWMATSPLALAAAVGAAAVLVRRAGLPPRVLGYLVTLAVAACAVMAVVVGAAAWWVATSGGAVPAGGPRPPFQAGLIDLGCTVVLALALPVAVQASRMARRELRLARGRSAA